MGTYNHGDEHIEILKTVFKAVFDAISNVVKTVFNGIKSFWDTWGQR